MDGNRTNCRMARRSWSKCSSSGELPAVRLKDPSPTNPTNFAMQEETLDPYFMAGSCASTSISMSQGRRPFNSKWNGRFHDRRRQ
jgi:hypothetical protein